MALKDHGVFFVIAACVATAAATWTVSEQLRVIPLKLKLDEQVKAHKSSPVITGVVVTMTRSGTSQIAEQNIEFSDPEGDAVFVNYVVLGTNAKRISLSSESIDVFKDEQIRGTTTVAKWTCGTGKYFIKLRAILTDANGHASLPHDYYINCN